MNLWFFILVYIFSTYCEFIKNISRIVRDGLLFYFLRSYQQNKPDYLIKLIFQIAVSNKPFRRNENNQKHALNKE